MTSFLAPFATVATLAWPPRVAGLVLAATPSYLTSRSAPRSVRVGQAAARTLSRQEATAAYPLIPRVLSHRPSVHQTRFAAADSLRPIESSPTVRTISGDGGVLLPRAELAARNVQGRRAANLDGPCGVRALGACQTTPGRRRQPHGDPAPQDYPPRASRGNFPASRLAHLADLRRRAASPPHPINTCVQMLKAVDGRWTAPRPRMHAGRPARSRLSGSARRVGGGPARQPGAA